MTSAGAPLIVERIRVTVLSVPLNNAVPMSFSQLTSRQMCLVEVDAGGVTGVGESWINYPPWAPSERLATLTEGVAPLILGHDVSSPEGVLKRLCGQLLPIARQWGAPGPMWQAISGVDIALWDLLGKAGKTSVSEILGGDAEPRSRVSAYASGVGPTEVDRLCEAAVQKGFEAIKTRVGFGETQDAETLSSARAVIGPDMQMFADANQAWDLDQAEAFCAAIERYNVAWLEEPLADNRISDLARLRETTGMRLATGENIYGAQEFEAYLESGALHVIQPDLAKSGGLSVGQLVTDCATKANTHVAPHCYSGAIGIAASLQLAAHRQCVKWIELDIRSNPLRDDLLLGPLPFSNGELQIPTNPGLGVELNPETVKRYMIHQEERSTNVIY